jgi:hypothetical protein
MANKMYPQLLASDAVEEAILLIREDYLHRLELFGKFSSCNTSVDTEDLAVWRLS